MTKTDVRQLNISSDDAKQLPERAPLGVLSLASILEEQAIDVRVIDLDRLQAEYAPSSSDATSTDFLAFLAPRFAAIQSPIFGLSSICSSYPLTIRLAELLKQMHPDSTIVLGGPQASAVDIETMSSYPCIDYVVLGEGEWTLSRLVHAILNRLRIEAIPGITYRTQAGISRSPDAKVLTSLDELPIPAYHLWDYGDQGSFATLEIGRGCPYSCKFCSTNTFFRKKYRVKSPIRTIEEMDRLNRRYGATTFDLVHDMLTVDRRVVAAFCCELRRLGRQYSWCCSARTDSVDRELLSMMAEAGCVSVFYGIETASPRMQQLIRKELDIDTARQVIQCTDMLGMRSQVSLIIGFPEETRDDLRLSVDFFC